MRRAESGRSAARAIDRFPLLFALGLAHRDEHRRQADARPGRISTTSEDPAPPQPAAGRTDELVPVALAVLHLDLDVLDRPGVDLDVVRQADHGDEEEDEDSDSDHQSFLGRPEMRTPMDIRELRPSGFRAKASDAAVTASPAPPVIPPVPL